MIGVGQRSTSVWFTLVIGTSRRRMPRRDAFVLDVGQHQSNWVVGSQVLTSPAHWSPVSVSAYQKYLGDAAKGKISFQSFMKKVEADTNRAIKVGKQG